MCCLVALAGCKKGDKVPAYVVIPGVELHTTDAQGSNSAKVTDVWVHADEELIGVYELPARVAVLRSGASTITVYPAVKRNGMFEDRGRYPFYTSWSGETDLVPAQATTVQPSVQYVDEADIWIEAFEDAGTNMHVAAESDTTLLLLTTATHPDLVSYGNACGGFVLDAAHPFFRMHTTADFEHSTGAVFLELDHRNNITFTVGMMFEQNGSTDVVPHVHITPTGTGDGGHWNKVYLDLSVAFGQAMSGRNIYIEASLPEGFDQGQVSLDNIKLVRFDQ